MARLSPPLLNCCRWAPAHDRQQFALCAIWINLGAPKAQPLTVFGNRGASGIDGVTSTALGIAAASDDSLVLITGDVAFYHDMNGLLAIKQHDLNNVTIVLLNNNGGGIFRRLPIAKFEPEFTPLFLTPHDLGFQSCSPTVWAAPCAGCGSRGLCAGFRPACSWQRADGDRSPN